MLTKIINVWMKVAITLFFVGFPFTLVALHIYPGIHDTALNALIMIGVFSFFSGASMSMLGILLMVWDI